MWPGEDMWVVLVQPSKQSTCRCYSIFKKKDNKTVRFIIVMLYIHNYMSLIINDVHVDRVSTILTGPCQLTAGDRVVVILPRVPEWWLLNIACCRMGASCVGYGCGVMYLCFM